MHTPSCFHVMCLCLLVLVRPLLATDFEDTCQKIAGGQGSDAQRLKSLIDATWAWQMREAPEDATFNGFPGVNDRWSDLSPEAIARRKRELEAPMRALQAILREKVPAAQQLDYDLFRR